MKKLVDVYVSAQAKLMLKSMPKIVEKELLEWFCNVRKISVGGGDLINYLSYLKDKEGRK